MTPHELQCYKTLIQIQSLCDSSYTTDSPVSFEYIWQVCQDQLNQLKISIGERVIEDENIE